MTARTVVIDQLRGSDLPRCAELELEIFADEGPWSLQALREELRVGHHYLAARIPAAAPGGQGLLVGYAGLGWLASPPRAEAEVNTIGVVAGHRGLGIGRALLRGLLTAADAVSATVFLQVRTDNEVARALYESEGFTVVGLRRRYYEASGADAHTMRREAR